jgi:hypothetical protein
LLHEKFQDRTFKDVENVGLIKDVSASLKDAENKIADCRAGIQPAHLKSAILTKSMFKTKF